MASTPQNATRSTPRRIGAPGWSVSCRDRREEAGLRTDLDRCLFRRRAVATRLGAVAITDALGTVVRVDQDGTVAFGPSWSDRACNWQITMAAPLRTTSRAYLSSSLVDCLEGLALRTTVPPSDVSRKNAGSATSDND